MEKLVLVSNLQKGQKFALYNSSVTTPFYFITSIQKSKVTVNGFYIYCKRGIRFILNGTSLVLVKS